MKKLILILFVTLMCVSVSLFMPKHVPAQIAEKDYDEDEQGTTPIRKLEFEEEDDELQRIFKYLELIRKGDKQVIKLMTYRTYLAMHDVVLIALGATKKSTVLSDDQIRLTNEYIDAKKVNWDRDALKDYYTAYGNQAGLPSFIAGLENQDPKVRLKVIGYLGDWVDEKNSNLNYILAAADARLKSALETRDEVKYGLFILKYKIIRYIYLMDIYNGDESKLKTISPKLFLVLVEGEKQVCRLFMPELYRKIVEQRIVEVNSIRLDPWKPAPYESEVLDDVKKGALKDIRRLNEYYYKYEREKAIRAIFSGLENPSLLVRERTTKLMLDIYFDWAIRTDAKIPVGRPKLNDKNYKPIKDNVFGKFADSAYHQRVAMKAWDEVVYASFSRADDYYDSVPERFLISKNEVDGVAGAPKMREVVTTWQERPDGTRRALTLTRDTYTTTQGTPNDYGLIPAIGGHTRDAVIKDGNRFELYTGREPLQPGDVLYERRVLLRTTKDQNNGVAKDHLTHIEEYLIIDEYGIDEFDPDNRHYQAYRANYRIHLADFLRRIGLAWYVGGIEREAEVTTVTYIDKIYAETLFNNGNVPREAFSGYEDFRIIDRQDLLEGEKED